MVLVGNNFLQREKTSVTWSRVYIYTSFPPPYLPIPTEKGMYMRRPGRKKIGGIGIDTFLGPSMLSFMVHKGTDYG